MRALAVLFANMVNGVINIYKEKGYTSFHVVYALRRITGEQKVGHTGTLDPDVSGVLPVCIGKATKLVGQLTDTDKTYRCRMRFGICTDTQDLSGQVTEQMEDKEVQDKLGFFGGPLSEEDTESSVGSRSAAETAQDRIRAALQSFVGEISQIPPMYSALKVDGMKLVNAARKGVVVERKPRKVTIHSIDDVQVSGDLLHVDFTVQCSKGTYVRTLCEDVGRKLGVPACMESLERLQAAGLTLEDAVTLDRVKELADEGRLQECVIPVDAFLAVYPSLTVCDEAVKKLIYGNYLYRADFLDNGKDPLSADGKSREMISGKTNETGGENIFRIYDRQGLFYALYRYDPKADCCKCVKMFRDPQ